MNCESCERPKKSRMTALSAFGLISWSQAPVNIFERFLLIMRRIFPQRLYHRVVMRDIDDVNFANLETHNLANRCQSERLERARDCDFTVAYFRGQHFCGELFFV